MKPPRGAFRVDECHRSQRATRQSLLPTLLVLGAGWLAASPSHAAVKGEWSDNVSHNQSFSRVLVVGVSPDYNQRCAFEYSMAAKLRSANTVAIVSCDLMPPKTPLTRESVEAAVAAQNADAVLATSLVSHAWTEQQGGTVDTRGTAQYKAADAYYGVYGTVVALDFRRAHRSQPSRARSTSRRSSMRRGVRRWCTRWTRRSKTSSPQRGSSGDHPADRQKASQGRFDSLAAELLDEARLVVGLTSRYDQNGCACCREYLYTAGP